MVTSSLSCPLCDGPAAVKQKAGSQFTHVMCKGLCHGKFIIGTTALRVLSGGDGAERRAKVRRVGSLPVPEGRIHVVAWSMAQDDAELSVEGRNSWLNR